MDSAPKKVSLGVFFLASQNLGRYAARAKGEGEGKRRLVNNLLTAWACGRVMPTSGIDCLRIGFLCFHSSSRSALGALLESGHFLSV
jgi:hypothetical protein